MPADAATIARIDAFVTAHNGDVSIRCGSLNPQADPPQTREWAAELDVPEWGFNSVGATLDAILDDLDLQIQNASPIFGE